MNWEMVRSSGMCASGASLPCISAMVDVGIRGPTARSLCVCNWERAGGLCARARSH